jgi:hypothetical protein
MSNAPHYDIDVSTFWADPYPDLAKMRKHAPIAFVPQLGSTVFTRRDDIFTQEKRIDVFSSHQPAGLMNRLMGHNMMRKDGAAHMAERKAMFPSVSPRAVRDTWSWQFQAHADRILDELAPRGRADLCKAFALPLSAECLKDITGLTNIRFEDLDAWSQAMIDGIANYGGDKEVEARCHAATAAIDAAIDDMIPVVTKHPNTSILSVLLAAGQPIESVRANIKLAISGGQNEPRRHLGLDLGAADPSRAPGAGARGQGKMVGCVRGICALDRADRDGAAAGSKTMVVWRRRFRAGGSRVLHVRLGQSRRSLLSRSRSFRHHPRYPEKHRVRRRPAFLRRRLCFARIGRRRRTAEHFCPIARLAARPKRAGADRRLGVSRAAQSTGDMGCGLTKYKRDSRVLKDAARTRIFPGAKVSFPRSDQSPRSSALISVADALCASVCLAFGISSFTVAISLLRRRHAGGHHYLPAFSADTCHPPIGRALSRGRPGRSSFESM